MFKTFTLVICYLTHVIQSDRSRDLKSSKDGNGISFDLYGDIYNSEIPENSNYIPATIISDINSNSASVACGILCEEGYCVNEHCKKCVINSDLILETDQSISNICLCKRGFFLSENSRCEKCGELCSECNNQVCLECIDKSILIPDPFNPRSCMCHNQGAFINDLCLTNPPRRLLCDSSCSTCLGSTPNDCLICSVSLIVPLSVPNSCTCATNEYMTVQNPKTCVSCYSACASCNGISDSSCTSCVDPSRTPGSGRCDCLTDQYYLDTINISCGDCHIDCATCSGPDMTDCDSCQDPSRILGSSPSKCTCDTNEFIESYNPFTCTACDPSCSTCSGPLNTDCLTCTNSLIFPATTPGLCECESNQFISNYNTLVCENCGYGCATCQGSGRYDCLSCIDPQLEMTLAVDSCECSAGFYLSSYNPVTCQPCYEACYKCNGPSATDCTECSLPYFINIAGRCDCPYGSYISIYNPVTCGICHGTCASCVGPNYDDCNTCATQGYVLGITPGPCSCLTGNYVASIDVFSCLPCDQTCKECSGGLDTECTSCADQNILGPDISGKCYCLSNQFINGYQPLECLDCHSSCATCSGSTLYDCLTCADQDVVILAPNRCSCIDGKYPIDLSPLTCLDCDSSCKTCKGSGKDECLTCKDNDMVQSISPGKCDCDAGQYIHNKNPLECFNCHNSCYSCDGQSDTDCIICKDSEISISESSHNCSCADDQFISNKRPLECAQCSNNCKRCSSDTTCTSCHSPKILYNGDCVCPDDHVMIDNQCLACESNCKKCGISPSDCTSCQEPFILLYSSCVCPKWYGGLNCQLSDVYLQVNDSLIDSKLSLQFSETLSSPLRVSDFTIEVISALDIVVKSELSLKEDDFYEISLNFTPKYFEVSAELEMRLSDKIHSKSGLYLLKTKFSYDLENYTYDPKTTASQILDEVIPPDTRTTIATISTVNAALSAFVVRDWSNFWTYVHISQLIAFLPLFSIKIPKTISDLFKGFSSFGWAPNIGSHIYGGYIETNQILIDSFLNYGYKSTLFVISSGKMIFIALAFIAVWAIVSFLHLILPKSKLRVLIDKTYAKFWYSGFMRLWLEIFVLFYCGALIGINNPDFSRPDFAVDYVLSCIFIGFGVFLNCQLFWFIFKYKPLVALRDSKFYVKYNSLFDEFKNDKGFFSMCYYPLYLARRLIFLITLYNLADYPLVQLLINIILGSISAGHILKYKPFKDLYLNKVNFVAELLVTTCMVLLIPYTIEDLSNLTQEMLQSILILITVIFLFYSYVLLIKDIIMKLINAIKKYRLKKISVIKVTDIKSNDNTLTNRNREDLEDDVKGAETTQFVNSQKLKEFF